MIMGMCWDQMKMSFAYGCICTKCYYDPLPTPTPHGELGVKVGLGLAFVLPWDSSVYRSTGVCHSYPITAHFKTGLRDANKKKKSVDAMVG